MFTGRASVSRNFGALNKMASSCLAKCWRGLLIAVLVTGIASTPSEAQGVGTVGVLLAGVDAAKQALSDAITDLGVQGQVVVGAAQSGLDGAIRDLRTLVNDDMSRQVSSLTGVALALAQQLQNTIRDIDRLTAIRTNCAFDGAERFAYGVKTILTQLQNALPLIKRAQPFIYTFAFDGHSPGVVPKSGGRLTLRGFGMWGDGTSPKVSLVDSNRHPIVALSPMRANDVNSLSATISSEILAKHVGECLAVEVTPRATEKHWLSSDSIVNGTPMFLPVCVPDAIDAVVSFKATGTFTCPGFTPEAKMESTIFDCTNDSCEHDSICHAEHSWPINDGCRIVRFDKVDGGNKYNNNTVTERIASASTIVADGGLDSATCVGIDTFFVHAKKRLHHTEYQKIITPYMMCSVNNFPRVDAESASYPVFANNVPICMSLTRPCLNDTASSYSLDVYVTHGQGESRKVISFSKITATTAQMSFSDVDYNGMHITAGANPRVGSEAQVCATVATSQCGY